MQKWIDLNDTDKSLDEILYDSDHRSNDDLLDFLADMTVENKIERFPDESINFMFVKG